MSRATNLQIAQGLSQGLQNFVQGYVQRKDQELARQRMQTKMQEDFQRINDPNTSLPEKAALMGQYNPQSAAVMMREGMRGQTEQDFWTQKLGNIADQTLSRPSAGMQYLPKETPRGMDLIRSMGTASLPGIGVNAFESPELQVPLQTSLQEEVPQQQAQVPKSPLAMLSDEDLVEGMGRLPHKAQMFKAEIERRGREKKLDRQEQREIRKETQPYVDELLDQQKALREDEAVYNQMESLNNSGKLTTPLMSSLLGKAGMPLGVLGNPESESFDKLSNQLTRTIQKYYGSRILQTEFHNFLRQIPTLQNSEEGRRMIIKNLQMAAIPKKIEYEAYKQVMKENGGIRPADLKERVAEKVLPSMDKWVEDMKKDLQSISAVKAPEGTISIITPDGRTVAVPKEKVKEALDKGGKLG